jgi:hypothetical protein
MKAAHVRWLKSNDERSNACLFDVLARRTQPAQAGCCGPSEHSKWQTVFRRLKDQTQRQRTNDRRRSRTRTVRNLPLAESGSSERLSGCAVTLGSGTKCAHDMYPTTSRSKRLVYLIALARRTNHEAGCCGPSEHVSKTVSPTRLEHCTQRQRTNDQTEQFRGTGNLATAERGSLRTG